MTKTTITQFELIMHGVETSTIEAFWDNHRLNNKSKPTAAMKIFINDTIKWTVGETFKQVMLEIFHKPE